MSPYLSMIILILFGATSHPPPGVVLSKSAKVRADCLTIDENICLLFLHDPMIGGGREGMGGGGVEEGRGGY
jgi:hypothetical protein